MKNLSSNDFMTATDLAAHAPLGAVIRFSDFTPAPPLRFKRKHAEWTRNNSTGRLISIYKGTSPSDTTITLHMGDYGSHGIIVISTRKTFMGTSTLRFAITERPRPGSVGIIKDNGAERELLHLASSHEAAISWLASNPHSNATLAPCPLPSAA
jgi:hypothetical protein